MNNTEFSSLNLSPALQENLTSLGYLQMTPIQAQSLPLVLDGKDLIAKAKTGSGKTAAFALGLLAKLNVNRLEVQALVLCPTRELADQVAQEIRRLARALPNVKLVTLCGGTQTAPQSATLGFGAHIAVGTPGRILKHLEQGTLELSGLKTLVLDEADRMLDMGFGEEINRVISYAPEQRQTLLFSATYPEGIAQMSRGVQRNPVEVSVESLHEGSAIEQKLYEVPAGQRLDALTWLLSHYQPASCVVFCNTKRACNDVADHLAAKGFSALALNGDLEQRERDQVLVRFANGSATILVATDVAARGLDIKELGAVINYELTYDPEVHVHRIGRTGRAGQQGLALSLYQPNEAQRVNLIEEYQQAPMPQGDLAEIGREIKPIAPQMVTLSIDAGRKTKVRAGDILGALTGEGGIAGADVGKIQISEQYSYVAVKRSVGSAALKRLQEGKIKGRTYRARKLG
ncbi:DEAD/DEAH box helicase [Aeromonas salmonicida subsp. salmonicida]|uniref:ATP-dependent RNA helicase DbpA n=2 Tax=Aeromonas salmonicida subsp. salmonicida TaxID=29491 RepID=A4SS33_AERS4|nr:ATP-dependent RNA helicase DbpA [Aeromonas salmonicida]ABO91705.1 ATP-dependent RNA helicase DbpA [Aeromonas salmonicida subsp. salmonicida A449]ASI24707.1 ATP-dependent RNA helicase [Aeromonas salmonicida]ASI29026.1 ATP-dependent RNA helicase [Aeromonas salmonicida]ASI33156.1 ATP-dependent RNA helicase [Aeromonas salmonicida]ATD36725.1 ATP-dependent RNA helicase DbpA [Aeromonas salmonicida subsp. masoucida]